VNHSYWFGWVGLVGLVRVNGIELSYWELRVGELGLYFSNNLSGLAQLKCGYTSSLHGAQISTYYTQNIP